VQVSELCNLGVDNQGVLMNINEANVQYINETTMLQISITANR